MIIYFLVFRIHTTFLLSRAPSMGSVAASSFADTSTRAGGAFGSKKAKAKRRNQDQATDHSKREFSCFPVSCGGLFLFRFYFRIHTICLHIAVFKESKDTVAKHALVLQDISFDVDDAAAFDTENHFNPRALDEKFADTLADKVLAAGVGQETGLHIAMMVSKAMFVQVQKYLRKLPTGPDNIGLLNISIAEIFGKGDATVGHEIIQGCGGVLAAVGQHRLHSGRIILERINSGTVGKDKHSLTSFDNSTFYIVPMGMSDTLRLRVLHAIRHIGAMDNNVKSFRKVMQYADVVCSMLTTVEELLGDADDFEALKKKDKALHRNAKKAFNLTNKRFAISTGYSTNSIGAMSKLGRRPSNQRTLLKSIFSMTTTDDGEPFARPTSSTPFDLLGHPRLHNDDIVKLLSQVKSGALPLHNLRAASAFAISQKIVIAAAMDVVPGLDGHVLATKPWKYWRSDANLSAIVRLICDDKSIKSEEDVAQETKEHILRGFTELKRRWEVKKAAKSTSLKVIFFLFFSFFFSYAYENFSTFQEDNVLKLITGDTSLTVYHAENAVGMAQAQSTGKIDQASECLFSPRFSSNHCFVCIR
jgi:hypothetical protein